MANTSIQQPTPTPDQWNAWRNCQMAARAFLQAPEGPSGKALVGAFQKQFNAATDCLAVIIRARGGDPSKSFAVMGGLPLSVDSTYGQKTCLALGLIVMFSFAPDAAKTAAGQLMNPPYTRHQVSLWTKAWRVQVANMVAGTYQDVVANSSTPGYSQADATTAGNVANNSQTTTQQKVDDAKSNDLQVPTTSSTSVPVVQTFPDEQITATAPKNYNWLWGLLGLSAAGGTLYWFFGRKKR